MNSFTFNGISTDTYGLYVGGQRTFNSPQRDVTKVSIPGRNGDLVRDNGRFLNVSIAYTVVLMPESTQVSFAEAARQLKADLLSVVGYARLEDTYQPDHFRMARVDGAIDFETGAYNYTGKTQVTFDCMPQRFLKSGETVKEMTPSSSIIYRIVVNPTQFSSKPLIRVYGSGDCEVTVGNQTITLEDVDDHIDIDSETMNCYNGVENCNGKVTLGSQGFPTLPPGPTTIQMAGGTTKVEITPRWWEL